MRSKKKDLFSTLIASVLLMVLTFGVLMIGPAHVQAQVAPGWQEKVTQGDKEILQEEERLEAYKKNVPELYRRAKEALERGDKANFDKYKAQLQATLDYMRWVIDKKYAPWYKPDYFDKTGKMPDGTPITGDTDLGVYEGYRYTPKELVEKVRKIDKEKHAQELDKAVEALKKQGFIKPEKSKDSIKTTPEQRPVDVPKALESCDPAEIKKAIADLQEMIKKVDQAIQNLRRKALREELLAEEEAEFAFGHIIIERAKKYIIDLEKKLKECKPPVVETKPTDQSLLPSGEHQYKNSLSSFDKLKESPEPSTATPRAPLGDDIRMMPTPSPSTPESFGKSLPTEGELKETCDMLVDAYKQELIRSANAGWKAPKPPAKGIYIAKFTYGIEGNGSLNVQDGVKSVKMIQSSGYTPMDQSAKNRILELFGPTAPMAHQGGVKRQLPTCFRGKVLQIDHMFKVLYQ